MSSRVLRKLQGEKELNDEISDNDGDLPATSGGARRKQLNVNRYDLVSILVMGLCHFLNLHFPVKSTIVVRE